MKHPFMLPDSDYKRDLNIISAYRQDTAKYLQLNTGKPLSECLEFINDQIKPDVPNGLRNPKSLVLCRNEHGDREPKVMGFMNFLSRVEREELGLSPSLAAYLPPSRVQSTHASYIAEGVAGRNRVKDEMFEAELAGDAELVLVKDGEQENLKINNNSYSGATVSQATILYYKSTHSSLTSTCRTATSYANAANEKFLAGNRHYYSPEVTKANIVSLINLADLDAIRQAIETHGLRYPNVTETMDCIIESTKYYWSGDAILDQIRVMVNNMTEAERAAVVYINDFYHLHKLNSELVEGFLLELSSVVTSEDSVSEEEFASYDSDVVMLANFLCFDSVKGRSRDELRTSDPAVYEQIKSTARNVYRVMAKYESIVNAFWLTHSVPSSIHAFPSSYRKTVIISDTDSTLFSLQYWVEQCFGHISYSDDAKRMVFGLVYLVSKLIAHILAIQSANMGVTKDRLRLLAMKNEYYFAVMSMTSQAKHYYASQDAREGIMLTTPRLEVKGRGLRDSTVPKKINDGAKELMEEIIGTIKAEEQLDMYAILKRVGDLEREIKASIESGSPEYMTTGQVKTQDSYKNPDNATYKQYELWRDVFGPFLGETQEPPYAVVRVSLMVNNKTELDAWCERMDNPPLAAKLQEYMLLNRRKDLTTLLVPATVVETSGIPKEILAAVDVRKIIYSIMGVYYLMLESLGILMDDRRITRLISDIY